jgi:cell division protein ZapA (FtsZ GTPase activity inhibitor)
MGELSIKIKIANRVYPLTVDSSEEEGIRNAAEKLINQLMILNVCMLLKTNKIL